MGIDEAERDVKLFELLVDYAKRYFGQWDIEDPVVWAILRVVEAQNDLADAIGHVAGEGLDESPVEAAIAERLKAIAELQEAIKREPRGFQ